MRELAGEAAPRQAVSDNRPRQAYIHDRAWNLFGSIEELKGILKNQLDQTDWQQIVKNLDAAQTFGQARDMLLNLPDMHGSEVLRKLQEEAETANIPVVILSANATPTSIERLLAAGESGESDGDQGVSHVVAPEAAIVPHDPTRGRTLSVTVRCLP